MIMNGEIKRREFLSTTAVGPVCMSTLMRPVSVGAVEASPAMRGGMSKVRIGKVYLGQPTPGWPKYKVDLKAEVQRFEAEFAKLSPAFEDVEFVGGHLIPSSEQLPSVMEEFKDVDGILAVHLTMGAQSFIKKFLELKVPIVMFAPLYAGHEWHIFASLQKQGEKIVVLPSSDFGDLVTAIRPFRAIHRLKESKVLYLMNGGPDPEYVKSIKNRFGTEIKTIHLPQLAEAYESVDDAQARADAKRWIDEAEKVVEPTEEEIYKSSRMYFALLKVLEDERANAITINCLGLGLIQHGMGYPCFGFSRLNGMGLGGICEADIKSTMTHLLFSSFNGKSGFVSDPVIDLSNNTIIHAHCVSAIKMDGPNGEQCPYIIRSHLEDERGASLQVKMRVGQEITMAKLIGADKVLFSTGKIIDIPDVDRGCRTKIVTQVKNAKKIMENWSCGLHRVVFYGDYTADLQRFCRFKDIRIVYEEEENAFDVPGLEWNPSIHA